VHRRFVLVTGLPAAGKTTLARQLAPALRLPLLSKDTVKETLFDVLGVRDREWSMRLGKASIETVWALAAESYGAVIDIWIDPSRDVELATERLAGLRPVGTLVEVMCVCPGKLAAQRYAGRARHPGHLQTDPATLERIRAAAALLEPLGIGPTLRVDTSRPVDLEGVLRWLAGALAEAPESESSR
jgi:hypothetical protein